MDQRQGREVPFGGHGGHRPVYREGADHRYRLADEQSRLTVEAQRHLANDPRARRLAIREHVLRRLSSHPCWQ